MRSPAFRRHAARTGCGHDGVATSSGTMDGHGCKMIKTREIIQLNVMTEVSAIALLSPLASFAVAIVLLAWLVRAPISRLAMDRPNARSLHRQPVPRTGGLAIVAGGAVGLIIASPGFPIGFWIGIVTLLIVGFIDDLRGVPILWRLLIQVLAASLALTPVLFGSFGLPATLIAVFTTVWMTNLFNFMDGSDGLAGGMAFFGFGFLGLAWWLGGDVSAAQGSLVLAAAAAAFLFFNFYPARIFMGDAGSVPLGFLAAIFGILGWSQNDWPFWFPILVFSPFIVDATVTLLKRMARGERFWLAHREHYYQRLVQIGFGHRNTALLGYGIMVAAGSSAIWALDQRGSYQAVVCIAWGVIFLAIMTVFDRRWKRFAKSAEERSA